MVNMGIAVHATWLSTPFGCVEAASEGRTFLLQNHVDFHRGLDRWTKLLRRRDEKVVVLMFE
jgi:hypothetical protein